MINKESIEDITDKDWEVLLFFIEKESEEILKNNHFSTYPGQMELIMEGMTRPTAGSACKKFSKMNILYIEKKYPPHLKGGRTDFYSLKSDLATIRILVELLYKKYSYKKFLDLIGKPYFTKYINESIVKQVLEEKNVTMWRVMSLLDWDEKEAKRILDIYRRNKSIDTDFKQFAQEFFGSFDLDHKKSEKSYIQDMSNQFNLFVEDCKDTSVDLIKKYYSNDYFLFGLLEYKRNDIWQRDLSDYYVGKLFSVPILLPVISDKASIDDVTNKIVESNSFNFNDINGEFYGHGQELIKQIYGGIQEHYERYQYEKLILPILTLIWCSPSALYEFLLGDWTSYTFYLNNKTNNQKELLSKLIHLVAKDVFEHLEIPQNTIIENVSSKLTPPSRTNITEDVCIIPFNGNNNDLFHNLNKNYWNSISYSGINRLYNPMFTIRLKHFYELSFDIGFVIESKPNQEKYVNVRISTDYRWDNAFRFLTIDDVKDPINLILKLRQKGNPLYDHIRNKLSNKIKNLILYHDIKEKPSMYTLQMIVNELNYAIIDGNFCDPKAFDCIKNKHEKIDVAIKYLSEHKFSRNQIINCVNGVHRNIDGIVVGYNRYLLEKALENELTPEYTSNIEGWRMKYLGLESQ